MYFSAREVFHWAIESHLASPNGIITFSGGKQTLQNAELTCGVLREHGLEQVPQGGRAPQHPITPLMCITCLLCLLPCSRLCILGEQTRQEPATLYDCDSVVQVRLS